MALSELTPCSQGGLSPQQQLDRLAVIMLVRPDLTHLLEDASDEEQDNSQGVSEPNQEPWSLREGNTDQDGDGHGNGTIGGAKAGDR